MGVRGELRSLMEEREVALRAAAFLLGNQLLRPRRRFPKPLLGNPTTAMGSCLRGRHDGLAFVRQREISGVLWVGWPSDRRLESILAARNLVVRSFLSSTGNLDWLNGVRGVSVPRRIAEESVVTK